MGRAARSTPVFRCGSCTRVPWGFAAGVVLTPQAAAVLVEQAVEVASVCRPVNGEPVVLATEPGYGQRSWMSDYEVNPFDVEDAEKVALFAGWSSDLLAAEGVDHVDAAFQAVQENKFLADLAGNALTQQRIRVAAGLTVIGTDVASGVFETMRTTAPAVARGWEYLLGTGWDWAAELAALPGLLAEKLAACSVEAGSYDLVIDATNLWLTIHESIGHATELDRALGYEAALAGHVVRYTRLAGHAAVRLAGYERDRRPGHHAWAGQRGVGRRRRSRPNVGL